MREMRCGTTRFFETVPTRDGLSDLSYFPRNIPPSAGGIDCIATYFDELGRLNYIAAERLT
jgi:hypothetical protein